MTNKQQTFKPLFFAILSGAFLSACTSFQLLGAIQQGRLALLHDNPEKALVHFQKATEIDPDYRLNLSILPEGVWTYVGRSYYGLGRLREARDALERAGSRFEEDNLARLYLGLTLLGQGEREKGIKLIEDGFIGLNDWLNHIEQYHPDGRYWDRGRRLRKEIEYELQMLGGKNINQQELIVSAEWLGQQLEEEMDKVQRDKLMEDGTPRHQTSLLRFRRDISGQKKGGFQAPPFLS